MTVIYVNDYYGKIYRLNSAGVRDASWEVDTGTTRSAGMCFGADGKLYVAAITALMSVNIAAETISTAKTMTSNYVSDVEWGPIPAAPSVDSHGYYVGAAIPNDVRFWFGTGYGSSSRHAYVDDVKIIASRKEQK